MRMRPRFLSSLTVSVFAAGVAVCLFLVGVQRDAHATDSNDQKEPAQPAARGILPFSPVPPPELLRPPAVNPATVYKVEPIPIRGIVLPRTEQQEKAVQAASDIVAKLRPIPEDRIRFFRWMNGADSPVVFAGWSIFVQQVVPTPQGQLITLRVSALSNSRDGSPVNSVMNNFIEEYLWSGAVLSGRMYMSRGQAEQPFGGRLNFRLGRPRA
jgi:hypothetical protein